MFPTNNLQHLFRAQQQRAGLCRWAQILSWFLHSLLQVSPLFFTHLPRRLRFPPPKLELGEPEVALPRQAATATLTTAFVPVTAPKREDEFDFSVFFNICKPACDPARVGIGPFAAAPSPPRPPAVQGFTCFQFVAQILDVNYFLERENVYKKSPTMLTATCPASN